MARIIDLEWHHQSPIGGTRSVWRMLTSALTAPSLALAYGAGTLLLLHGRTRWQKWLRVFTPHGRMAFTNYLTQSIVFSTVFYGYGLGLIGKLGYTAVTSMGIAFYVLQGIASAFWLRRFRFGPFEWAWRCLTYGRWEPMRAALVAPRAR